MSALRQRLRLRIFWRVYLHGLTLLIVVGVAAAVITAVSDGGPAWRETREQVHHYLAQRLRPFVTDPPALARELAVLHEIFGAEAAVYDGQGRLLAAAGGSIPPAESVPPTVDGNRPVRDGWRWLVPLGGDTYLLADTARRGPGSHLVVVLGVVLLLLAGVSLPLVRTVVRPLERLTEAARRLGAGDLAARSGVDRADEVGQLARAFDDMAARLAQLLRTEKELLANVSHELRTPLSRIRVALQLAEEAGDQDKLRARLAGIGTDLAELEGLVDDTLAAARLDAVAGQGVPLRLERVGLEEVAARARHRFVELHPRHTLVVDVERDLPQLDADPALLRRALDNVLDNAARYAEPAAGSVELWVGRSETGVGVEIRDRGIGVDAADLPELFTPFYRADKSRARATGGVGLGLALCRRIVEAHRGRIGARLRDGGGLVVAIDLPVDAR